jgi:phosphate transport system permease protein
VEAVPALTAPAEDIPGDAGLAGYVAPLLFGTLLAAVIALLVATPLAVAIALFIAYYAPRRLAQGLGYVVDLLAAIPSIVYGFWGIFWLAPKLVPLHEWVERNLGFIPLFAGPASTTGRTMLTAAGARGDDPADHQRDRPRGLLQVPSLHREAALALGRHPLGDDPDGGAPLRRSGVIGGAMLGLGRALGRDDGRRHRAVGLRRHHVQPDQQRQPRRRSRRTSRCEFPESSGIDDQHAHRQRPGPVRDHLAVNMLARAIVNRRADFSGAN